jgi:regulator of chromosome condensation
LNKPPIDVLNVYVFGNGEGGELGLGAKKKKRDPTVAPVPVLNSLLGARTHGVVQVSVGGMHSAALTRDGQIFTWGVNDNLALGRDTTWEEPPEGNPPGMTDLNPRESTPSIVPLERFMSSPDRIVQVAACDNATFALSSDGRVYGWGSFRV